MSVGKKIRQLRELRNFTQNHLANALGMSIGGYSKIERDETDVSVQRLMQIADVLKTDVATILNFDSKQVFNQTNFTAVSASGIVQNQHFFGEKIIEETFSKIKVDIESIKTDLSKLQKNSF
jgi:transcriptional regulator with XRE-family HTH domain